MLNCLLIGYGEIGAGIKEAYERYHKFDVIDIKIHPIKNLDKYDVMCVAIPYSDSFLQSIKEYQEKYMPSATIIFSTVPVGTTKQLENTVHVPIEGKHPNLAESIRKWQVFMGGKNKIAYQFFVDAGKLVYQLECSDHTEFLKLQSTTNYGLMIEYARYINECCKKIGMNYEEVTAFNTAYNQLYKLMGINNYQRYIVTPPDGKKGGHCVTPNAKILSEQFPSILVDIVAEVKNDN
jgi:hypothetical protein